MHAFVELAEYRRQDYLAEAARERLAKEVHSSRPLASQRVRKLWSLTRTVCTSACGALGAMLFHASRPSSEQNEHTMLTAAR